MSDKVTPFLWFADEAERAAKLYVSLFPRSKILGIAKQDREVLTVTFQLDGRRFIALNGGPAYQLTPAYSMFVSCKDQREIDRLWRALVRGGKPSRCGWLVDRFGLSWQIIPDELPALIATPGGMKAMFTMSKIDLAALREAARG